MRLLFPSKMDRNHLCYWNYIQIRTIWGTFAHKDIAFKFASWISVEFELYIVKEFQRLKEQEQAQLGWSQSENYLN